MEVKIYFDFFAFFVFSFSSLISIKTIMEAITEIPTNGVKTKVKPRSNPTKSQIIKNLKKFNKWEPVDMPLVKPFIDEWPVSSETYTIPCKSISFLASFICSKT